MLVEQHGRKSQTTLYIQAYFVINLFNSFRCFNCIASILACGHIRFVQILRQCEALNVDTQSYLYRLYCVEIQNRKDKFFFQVECH